jgi:hypothetical protein
MRNLIKFCEMILCLLGLILTLNTKMIIKNMAENLFIKIII